MKITDALPLLTKVNWPTTVLVIALALIYAMYCPEKTQTLGFM